MFVIKKKSPYIHKGDIMRSKYEKDIFNLLTFSKIKSTNEILKELEKASGKKINWHLVYRVLKDLESAGDTECLKSSWGLFWKRKN